jgi:hypothetical protein
VPVHRKDAKLPAIRKSVIPSSTPTELIIVMNNKELEGSIRPEGAGERIVTSDRIGRGYAFVRGAMEARGDIVLLLHSDTLLPEKWDRAITRALDSGRASCGAFSLSFDMPSLYLRALILLSDAFYYLTGEVWGDRAIFMRREILRQCLDAMNVPLLEDVRVSECLRERGRILLLKEKVVTSAEGFLTEGMVRHAWKALWCRLLYALGASPQSMYDYYYR